MPLVFVFPPSTGDYLRSEDRDFPRDQTWTSSSYKRARREFTTPDHPELQGLNLPEWSDLERAWTVPP